MQTLNHTSRGMVVITCVVAVLFGSVLAFAAQQPADASKAANNKVVLQKVMKAQVPFVANEGQVADKSVKFYTRTFGGNFYVRENGEMVYLAIQVPEKSKIRDLEQPAPAGETRSWVLKETLAGTKGGLSPSGKDPAKTKVNSFIGSDRSKWKTNMATFGSVSLGEVYKGITLSLRAYGKSVEKIFTVSPGGDPSAIRLRVEGARSLEVSETGELLMGTGLGDIRFSKPAAFQEKDGKKVEVAVAYAAGKDMYAFKVGEYDKEYPLIIDPYYLAYSTYLGGSGEENAYGIAVDASGSAYVTGSTTSANFPAAQGTYKGGEDVFVAKFSPDGASLDYATYLGGSGNERGYGIAVDASGSAYVAGFTGSSDFPVTDGGTHAGSNDVFAAKLWPDGSLAYAIFRGGSGDDRSRAIAVDASGNAYVSVHTPSPEFPVTSGTFSGGYNDIVVMMLSPTGSPLVSRFLGGSGDDYEMAITLDASGYIYVAGHTSSTDFPVTGDAYQAANAGDYDAFVAKLSPVDLSIVYATYLGGTWKDQAYGVGVSASGDIFLTGLLGSTDFPVTTGGGYKGGPSDAYVAKLRPGGAFAARYLGGSADDDTYSLAVDSAGDVYVAGITNSTDFPVTDGRALSGYHDAFIAKLSGVDLSIAYAAYLGGSGTDYGQGIAVDGSGAAYMTGVTWSTNFHVTPGAYKTTLSGSGDAFVAKFSFDSSPPVYTQTSSSPASGQLEVSVGISEITATATISDTGTGIDPVTIQMTVTSSGGPVNGTSSATALGGGQYLLRFIPTGQLSYNTTYTVTVNASDLGGNAMAAYSYTFTTQTDTTGPWITSKTPGDGSHVSDLSTNIVVTFTDNLSGWSAGPTVTLSVTSEPLPQGSGAVTSLYSNQTLACTVNGLFCTATFNPLADLPANSVIHVTASTSDFVGNPGTETFSFDTQVSVGPPATDDGDNISAAWKTRLGLPSGKRTLFIKPVRKVTSESTAYWSEFKDTYHSTIQGYFNGLFETRRNVGLQIVVIGDQGNPYEPMRNFDYDPATDNKYPGEKPPVSIITVEARGAEACPGSSYEVGGPTVQNSGHTKLRRLQGYTEQYSYWGWDGKGYTAAAGTSMSGKYHGPVQAGLHALACYMEEGAYAELGLNMTACATNCKSQSCCLTAENKSSDEYVQAPSKVAFNAFQFDLTNATITGPADINAAYSMTGYSKEDVLIHTLVHEIVHALLTADSANSDHCENPCCPMYSNVARQRGWTLKDLNASSCSTPYKVGPAIESTNQPQCSHGKDGAKDITAYGVVWNDSH
jgi:hypothetical protein